MMQNNKVMIKQPTIPGKMILGFTGTIASGKSTVSRYMEQQLGALRIDADLVGRDVVQEMSLTLSEVFGKEILFEDGLVNRKALGAIVFNDPEKLQTLNQMVHPAVCRKIYDMAKEAKEEFILVEAIELFRSDLKDMVDTSIVVYAEPILRKERLMKERGLSEEEAEARITAQMEDTMYLSMADHVIRSTDGPLSGLMQQCDTLIGILKKEVQAERS